MRYSLDDFDYELPEERIAQKPAEPRDHARLLVYDRKTDRIEDDSFFNLGHYLPAGTTLVANNSRVEKCRLLFDGGAREIFVTEKLDPRTVRALVRPGRHFRQGQTVDLDNGLRAEVVAVADDGIRTLRLTHPPDDPVFDPYRATPFPPYIRRDETLSDRYQTVYADAGGSKAAPTAGLHFTRSLIGSLREEGFGWAEVTLHVGLGTFAPVKSVRLEDHVMHTETYRIDTFTAGLLNRSKHITAVGTTSVRVLESAIDENGLFHEHEGETGIFITPGYRFRSVDALITNFHLPKSTLLMLVSAFAGVEKVQELYRHAIRSDYRFYSFGDAMLIL